MWNADAAKGVEYSYDGEGRLALTRDYLQDQQTRYTYDMAGRVTEVNILDENWDQGTIRTKTKYTYQNGTNRLTRLEYATPELGSATSRRTETAGVAYGTGMYTDRIMSVGTSTGYYSARVLFEYDDLGRLTKRRHITAPWGGFPETTYTYVAGASGTTTNLLATVNNEGMDLLTYTYDSMGNIQTVKSGSKLETYTYDSLNQLVRVDSQRENKSITYTYDNRGNLLERKEYAYTTGTLGTATKTVSYAYGDSTWKDLMTSYSGQTITYDTIGNPLKYRDGMNFTWKNGRQLATYSKGPISASYEYDINGQRTKKTFNTVAGSVTTEYYYNNGMFLGFYRSDGFDVRPLMDPSGSMYGITVYETNQTAPRSYNFVYNAQGDVIGLYSYITGSVVATYDYDAWGNCTVKALIADDNHIGQPIM